MAQDEKWVFMYSLYLLVIVLSVNCLFKFGYIKQRIERNHQALVEDISGMVKLHSERTTNL